MFHNRVFGCSVQLYSIRSAIVQNFVKPFSFFMHFTAFTFVGKYCVICAVVYNTETDQLT